ncbi:MAG: adenylyltransferase/cytidyltransferase family protein [Nanobdellota archaeon]
MEKKVMVFGTFDILHKGHINFLKQSRKHGQLIVVVGTDHNVEKIKGKRPLNTLEKRIENISSLKIAREVLPGYDRNFFKIIEEKIPDTICLGYDQKTHGLEEYLKKNNSKIKLIRLSPYKENKYKSSILRKILQQ